MDVKSAGRTRALLGAGPYSVDRVVRTNFFFINLLQVDKLGTNKYKLSENSDFALGLNPGGGNPILYFTQFTEVPGS